MENQYNFKTKKTRLMFGFGLISFAVCLIFLTHYTGNLEIKDKLLLFILLFFEVSITVITALVGLIVIGIESAEEAEKEKDLELQELKQNLQDSLANLDPLFLFSSDILLDQLKSFRLFINEYYIPLDIKEIKPLLRYTANLLRLVYENLDSTKKRIIDEIKYKRERNEISGKSEEWDIIIIRIRFHREEMTKIKSMLHRFYDHLEELAKINKIEIIEHGLTEVGYLTYADPVKPVK